jgi:hypothetical protein
VLRPAFVFGLTATGLSAVRSLGRRGVPIVGFSYRRDDPGPRLALLPPLGSLSGPRGVFGRVHEVSFGRAKELAGSPGFHPCGRCLRRPCCAIRADAENYDCIFVPPQQGIGRAVIRVDSIWKRATISRSWRPDSTLGSASC